MLAENIKDFIGKYRLFGPGDRLLVAVSGGMDSVTLLHLLLELKYSIGLTHCNFQLRGKESDKDAEFVRELAETHALPYHEVSFDTKNLAEAGESTQMTARRLRYDYFKKILDEYKYDRLVTAHHLDDNRETQLINLLRGNWLRGMRGMLPLRDRLARPLLETPRPELRAYAREHNLRWREDDSNATDDYLRNRVRHHLLPLMNELGATDGGSRQNLRWLRNQEGLLDWLSHQQLPPESDGSLVVSRNALPEDREMARTLLWQRTQRYGFTPEQLRQLVEGRSDLELDGTAGWVSATEERLTFHPGERPAPATGNQRTVNIDRLPFTTLLTDGTTLHAALLPRPADLTTEGIQYLRPIKENLHLRPRQNGDKFQPLGMGGHQKIKDFVINNKLNGDTLLLLCTEDDRIVAVVGHRISEAFRVRPEDEEVLAIWVE